VRAHDPVADKVAAARFGDRITLCDSTYEAARGADALVLATEWHEFRRPNFQRLKDLLVEPTVFDGRNIWEPTELRASLFG